MGTVDLEGVATDGQSLTIQALGAPSGEAGNLMATQVNINGNLDTQGGSLSILNMEGVDVASGVTVSTRNISGTGRSQLRVDRQLGEHHDHGREPRRPEPAVERQLQ